MPTSTASRWGSRLGQTLLTVTAVIGALGCVLVLLALVTGVRPVVFRSGSMEPAVGTGALGFSRSTDASDLKVGDVVTVTTQAKKSITHRIVAIGPGADSTTLRLKGDDNGAPDEEIYTVTSAPRLLFDLPKAGYVVAWFANAPGSYLLGGYVMLMLMLAFRRRTDEGGSAGSPETAEVVEPDPAPAAQSPVRRNRRGPFAVATAGAIVALAAAVVSGWSQSTWAAWTDTVDSSGTSIATGTWGVPAAPVVTSCTRSGNSITLNWTAAVNPTNFRIQHTNPTTEPLIAGTLRTATTQNANFNNSTGQIWIVAINGSGTSPQSNRYAYTGNGSNAVCTPVP